MALKITLGWIVHGKMGDVSKVGVPGSLIGVQLISELCQSWILAGRPKSPQRNQQKCWELPRGEWREKVDKHLREDWKK